MRFDYADESDRVRYPIPRGVHIEGGRDADGDRHALLLDRGALPALRAVRRSRAGPARGPRAPARRGTCARRGVRPAGWTSADAAGLPILPLLARHDEVRARAGSTTRCG